MRCVLATSWADFTNSALVREAATIGWGLSCGAGECLALATANEDPARVRTVDLKPRTTAFRRGSRQAGSRDVALSDAIAKAALDRVMDLFRRWAAECDPADPLTDVPRT